MIGEDLQKFSESRVMRTIAIGRVPIRNLPKKTRGVLPPSLGPRGSARHIIIVVAFTITLTLFSLRREIQFCDIYTWAIKAILLLTRYNRLGFDSLSMFKEHYLKYGEDNLPHY
ncbi:hypothetical protein AVEN_239364-1 [Araneus ventricosus]|uniref:Uncharacterized protein n=1 Tax=Araneus ventricosus TaxID=182803 RepID=A0A4Y2EDL0_ARAVE|nr:hypothetical protein AVEN_239364-1 [Araneus ventricosus]